MKKFFLLLVMMPLMAYCQKTDTLKAKRFSIGLSYSPDYCYRFLASPNSLFKGVVEVRNKLGIPTFGYTTGVNFAYRFNRRFTLEFGAMFSKHGENMNFMDLIYSAPNPNDPIKAKVYYRYYYIGIPIKVDFDILTKRAKLYATAGISPNIFIMDKTITFYEYSDGTITEKSRIKDFAFSSLNLAAIAGIGFSYDFTKHFYIRVEPTFRCSIISINQEPVKDYLYSVGLNTGLYFKL